MTAESENLILELLGNIRADMADLRAELKGDMHTLRADVAADLLAMQARNDAEHKATREATRDQIAGLRRAVVEYHSVVIGHGVAHQRSGRARAPAGAASRPAGQA